MKAIACAGGSAEPTDEKTLKATGEMMLQKWLRVNPVAVRSGLESGWWPQSPVEGNRPAFIFMNELGSELGFDVWFWNHEDQERESRVWGLRIEGNLVDLLFGAESISH